MEDPFMSATCNQSVFWRLFEYGPLYLFQYIYSVACVPRPGSFRVSCGSLHSTFSSLACRMLPGNVFSQKKRTPTKSTMLCRFLLHSPSLSAHTRLFTSRRFTRSNTWYLSEPKSEPYSSLGFNAVLKTLFRENSSILMCPITFVCVKLA